MWDNQIISSFAFSFFLCCDRSRLLSFFKGKSKNRTFQEISQDINGNIVEDETITLQDVCNQRNEGRRNILIISFIPLANVIISSLWFTIRFSLDQLMITYKESNKWWQIQKLQLQKLSISNEKIEMILLQIYFSSLY